MEQNQPVQLPVSPQEIQLEPSPPRNDPQIRKLRWVLAVIFGIFVLTGVFFAISELGQIQQAKKQAESQTEPPQQTQCINDGDCVLAIRIGTCCSCPEAVSREALKKDGHLVEYEFGKDYSKEIKDNCQKIICSPCAPLIRTTCQSGKCKGIFEEESESATANWKTYTNTKRGFLMKYPPDWSFEEKTEQLVIFNPRENGGYIQLVIASNVLRGITPCEQNRSNCSFIVDNKIFGERTKGATKDEVFLPGILGDYDIGITLEEGEDDYSLIPDLMLSTFKFTSQEESRGEKVFCPDPRPEVCTMECIANPPYICGSDGKSYCSVCQACSHPEVKWYVFQETGCQN